MPIEDVSRREQSFDLFAYFAGRSRAWGLFEDRFGRLRREFSVSILGIPHGEDRLRLEEDFLYSDGETQRRVWDIRRTAPGCFVGTAGDVLGLAQGRAAGNTLHWRYAMSLKINGTAWRVDFDDRMFLQPDDVLLSRARVTKWGIALGEVTLAFRREETAGVAVVEPVRLRAAS